MKIFVRNTYKYMCTEKEEEILTLNNNVTLSLIMNFSFIILSFPW